GSTFIGEIPPPQQFLTDTVSRTYIVTLIGTNICGSDTARYSLIIKPSSVRAFIYQDTVRGCSPLTVHFQDFSTSTVGGTFTHNWVFGDGTTSSDPNPIHTFINPGSYQVIEYVGNGCGFSSDTTLIQVLPSPTLSFAPPPYGCAHQPVTIINTTTDPISTFWQFSNGDTTSAFNPTNIFLNPGTYSVTLTGTSRYNGCSATAINSIVIRDNPHPTFVATGINGCQPLLTSFTNGTLDAAYFSWNFGDGNSSTAANPVHLYDTAGTFHVVLRGTDLFGCYADTSMADVNVYPIPRLAFSPKPRRECGLPAVYYFENNTVGANGFFWDFGNGQFSTTTNPTATYTATGTYTVTLIANNQFGCPDTLRKAIEVRVSPHANYSVPVGRGCQPFTAIFEEHSSGANGFFWDFGDGTTSTLANPIHTFYQAGNFDIQLVVNFDGICFDTIRFADTVRVSPRPTADFIYTQDLNQFVAGTVNFTSQAYPYSGVEHYWDFGDGSAISFEKNPTHRYYQNGGKAVQLIVQNIYGCRDTAVKEIIPAYFEGLWVPSAFSPETGVGDVMRFFPKGVGIKQYHIQIFTQWGELIWESDKLDNGQPAEFWDGTFEGKIVPQDVYVWRCEAVFDSGNVWAGMPDKTTKIRTKVGSLTVLR
ncbi:MAG: hypothetical protein RI894_21, partial [Bacteroidota bacterium]